MYSLPFLPLKAPRWYFFQLYTFSKDFENAVLGLSKPELVRIACFYIELVSVTYGWAYNTEAVSMSACVHCNKFTCMIMNIRCINSSLIRKDDIDPFSNVSMLYIFGRNSKWTFACQSSCWFVHPPVTGFSTINFYAVTIGLFFYSNQEFD